MTEPMSDDRLRQLRILVAEDVGGFTNEAVASLIARLDELTAERNELLGELDKAHEALDGSARRALRAEQRAAALEAERDQLKRRLDAAEAATCRHDDGNPAFDALERLHARIHRDFNFDASESAAPDDERWARVMDDLVTFADKVYLPLADAQEAAGGVAHQFEDDLKGQGASGPQRGSGDVEGSSPSIPVPAAVTAVAGCSCGGLDWHDPKCTIWSVPAAEAAAAIGDAHQRLREHTDDLNRQLHGETSDVCAATTTTQEGQQP
jgi:hypothetical protein